MKLDVVLVFIFAIIIGIGLYFLYPLYFGESQQFMIQAANFSEFNDNSPLVDSDWSGGMLFYDNIRYSSNEISYSLDSRCDQNQISDAREAFQTIDKLTVLAFSENDNGEIFVSCPEEGERSKQDAMGGHYIAGEGGPSSVINTSNYYLILNGSIILYTDNKCDSPIIATHELLHALGFKHSSNKRSIMYNVSNCNQQISGDIIDRINNLYQDPSLADLTFVGGSASKTGKYVNFKIEVLNAGLKKSNDFKLKLFINGKETGKYNIESLVPGSGKILKVDNLFYVGNAQNLEFVVDDENNINEINEDNNQLAMAIG
ncbi:MAG: CARDB domain-containing protein [Nanoarchaeota archaeon]